MITLWITDKGVYESDCFFMEPLRVDNFQMYYSFYQITGHEPTAMTCFEYTIQVTLCTVWNSKYYIYFKVHCSEICAKYRNLVWFRVFQMLSYAIASQGAASTEVCRTSNEHISTISVLIALVVIILMFPFGTNILKTCLFSLSWYLALINDLKGCLLFENSQLWLEQLSSVYILERTIIHEQLCQCGVINVYKARGVRRRWNKKVRFKTRQHYRRLSRIKVSGPPENVHASAWYKLAVNQKQGRVVSSRWQLYCRD